MSFHNHIQECAHHDWQKTSYGVGHHHRPGYYFPNTDFQQLTKQPLPPLLAKQDEVPNEQKSIPSSTHFHDRKFPNGIFGQVRHNKPPDHWKVTYMKDVVEKLNKSNFRRPLSPSHQMTETQENYKAEPSMDMPETFESMKPPKEHADNSMLIKGDIQQMKAPTHYTVDPSLVKYLDPYISTSHLNHRPFNLNERRDVKDQPTYWNCEDYTKAWGHGPKHNPLPKHAVPREPLPMRDTMVFKEATKIGPMAKPLVHVAHSGLKSEYTENYQEPTHVNMKYMDNCICPLDTPYLQPKAGAKATYTAPNMYDKEYNNIGRAKPVTV